MKKLLIRIILFVLLSFNLSIPDVASSRTVQTYIERQTIFNSVTDYFATFGKSNQERARIKHKRRWSRRTARLREIRK